MNEENAIITAHVRFVEGTQPNSAVLLRRIHVGLFTKEVTKAVGCTEEFGRVFLSTRCLKHMYDKRPAVEFDFILYHIIEAIKLPDQIYQNKKGKRGDFVFRKEIDGINLLVLVETIQNGPYCEYEISTSFWNRKESYLKDYNPLWSWGDGEDSHRNALDASKS